MAVQNLIGHQQITYVEGWIEPAGQSSKDYGCASGDPALLAESLDPFRTWPTDLDLPALLGRDAAEMPGFKGQWSDDCDWRMHHLSLPEWVRLPK